jgi:hypothetical protein
LFELVFDESVAEELALHEANEQSNAVNKNNVLRMMLNAFRI